MGNRANVIFVAGERVSPAIYLHWNGGPESVYAFLAELDRREIRQDADYEAARFVQIVGEFFSKDEWNSGLSLGLVSTPPFTGEIDAAWLKGVYTDPSDNGFYVVDRNRKQMRRFLYDEEWPPERVAAESHEAILHPSFEGILSCLHEIGEWRRSRSRRSPTLSPR